MGNLGVRRCQRESLQGLEHSPYGAMEINIALKKSDEKDKLESLRTLQAAREAQAK